MSKRNINNGVGIFALAIGWYAFRPELLFINKTVNEEFPGGAAIASIEKGPMELTKGSFKGYWRTRLKVRLQSISSPMASVRCD